MEREEQAGLYVHIPFCATRCPYCDFNVFTGAGSELQARYLAALHADVERVAAAGPAGVAPPSRNAPPAADQWPTLGSVFVGGGTPTQTPARDLAGLLRRIRDVLPVAEDAEISVEANPEDVSVAYLEELAAAGLTRLSIGAQSFAPHVLAFLGRRHPPDAALEAVAAAHAAGVARTSLDLMYGAPCETRDDWLETLDVAVGAGTGHLSAYALTVEANTPYAGAIRRGEMAAPDDDVQADRMRVTAERLHAAGFGRYEISNWAKPGQESRHNLRYWRGGNWLAVGAGAHGHWADAAGGADTRGARSRRWWTRRPTIGYTDAALAGRSTVAGEEILDEPARRAERLLLGLRLAEGVSRAAVEPIDEAEARRLAEAGLLVDEGHRLTLTARGQPLADDLTARLLPER